MTKQRQVLRVDFKRRDGSFRYAQYDDFTLAAEDQNFKLESVGKYEGNAGRCFAKT